MQVMECAVVNCDNPRKMRQWCPKHYVKFYRAKMFPVGKPGRPQQPIRASLISDERPSVIARKLGVSRQRVHQLMNQDKHRARARVAKALESGNLIKPDRCERCGKNLRLHAHHDDYALPLVVRWVCSGCHSVIHPHHPFSQKPRPKEEVAALRRARLDKRIMKCALFHTVRAKCAELRYEFKWDELAKQVHINGHLCCLRAAAMRTDSYVAIHSGAVGQFDFLIYHIKRVDRWLIVPASATPRKSTLFSLEAPRASKPGARSNRSDWRSYLDAWHLLET